MKQAICLPLHTEQYCRSASSSLTCLLSITVYLNWKKKKIVFLFCIYTAQHSGTMLRATNCKALKQSKSETHRVLFLQGNGGRKASWDWWDALLSLLDYGLTWCTCITVQERYFNAHQRLSFGSIINIWYLWIFLQGSKEIHIPSPSQWGKCLLLHHTMCCCLPGCLCGP